MGRYVFAGKWLSSERFGSWIVQHASVHKPRCKLRRKDIDILTMGEAALVSHMTSKKHKDLEAHQQSSLSITSFLPSTRVSTGATAVPPVAQSASSGPSAKDILVAEIYWALNIVTKYYSFKSSEKSADLFQQMFPDSAIAAKFACGERK